MTSKLHFAHTFVSIAVAFWVLAQPPWLYRRSRSFRRRQRRQPQPEQKTWLPSAPTLVGIRTPSSTKQAGRDYEMPETDGDRRAAR